jgi:hypothetical protein
MRHSVPPLCRYLSTEYSRFAGLPVVRFAFTDQRACGLNRLTIVLGEHFEKKRPAKDTPSLEVTFIPQILVVHNLDSLQGYELWRR